MKILLIVPAYNEEKNIVNTCRAIVNYDASLDFVVVNDGSTDATAEVCRKNGIPCLNLVQNLGIGGAVQTGYQYALANDYDIAVQFDGDGQHDIESLHALIAPILNDTCDFCIGSRFLENGENGFKSSFIRRIGICFFTFLIRFCTGVKVTDPTSGYRAGNKEVMRLFARDYPLDYPEPESIVHLLKINYRLTEVPVNMLRRVEGCSSINAIKSIYYMVKVSVAIMVANANRKVKG